MANGPSHNEDCTCAKEDGETDVVRHDLPNTIKPIVGHVTHVVDLSDTLLLPSLSLTSFTSHLIPHPSISLPLPPSPSLFLLLSLCSSHFSVSSFTTFSPPLSLSLFLPFCKGVTCSFVMKGYQLA